MIESAQVPACPVIGKTSKSDSTNAFKKIIESFLQEQNKL